MSRNNFYLYKYCQINFFFYIDRLEHQLVLTKRMRENFKSKGTESHQEIQRAIQIQLDLYNNALVYLNHSVQLENISTIKEVLLRKLRKKSVNKLFFIKSQKGIRGKSSFSKFFQKKITDYIDVVENVDYLRKLKGFLLESKDLRGKIQLSLFNEIIQDKIKTLQLIQDYSIQRLYQIFLLHFSLILQTHQFYSYLVVFFHRVLFLNP